MLEYMIGTTRRNGKSLRYLRIKSDAEIGLTGDLVTFTQTQEDKVSVYEVIVGDLLREESGDGLFYRWYEVESVLVETDHTPQLAAEVEDMAQATVAASIVFTVMAETEARSKSNTHRLDHLEKSTEAINRLATSVEVMAKEQKHQTEAIKEVKTDLSDLSGKVEKIEAEPGNRWKTLVEKVILLVTAAVVGYILARVGL